MDEKDKRGRLILTPKRSRGENMTKDDEGDEYGWLMSPYLIGVTNFDGLYVSNLSRVSCFFGLEADFGMSGMSFAQ